MFPCGLGVTWTPAKATSSIFTNTTGVVQNTHAHHSRADLGRKRCSVAGLCCSHLLTISVPSRVSQSNSIPLRRSDAEDLLFSSSRLEIPVRVRLGFAGAWVFWVARCLTGVQVVGEGPLLLLGLSFRIVRVTPCRCSAPSQSPMLRGAMYAFGMVFV